MATGPDKYAGEHCKKVGLSIEQFYSASTCVHVREKMKHQEGTDIRAKPDAKVSGTPLLIINYVTYIVALRPSVDFGNLDGCFA